MRQKLIYWGPAVLLICALALSVYFGAQTRPWSWGPAMLLFCGLGLASLPSIFINRNNREDSSILAVVFCLTTVWFLARAFTSPVNAFGSADTLLLAAAVLSFVGTRASVGNRGAERIILIGLAGILLAHSGVALWQLINPEFTLQFGQRSPARPSGLFSHYNYASSFLVAGGAILAGVSSMPRHGALMRSFVCAVAILSLGTVFITGSRGGAIAATAAIGTFLLLFVVMAKSQGRNWAHWALLLLPLLLVGLGCGAYFALLKIQTMRAGSGMAGMDSMFDNESRLSIASVAISCILTHPWIGGGSMSFSWESLQQWDRAAHGLATSLPELVHNEILQAATDYGIIGAVLVLLSLVLSFIFGLIYLLLSRETRKDSLNGWRLGGIVALVGLAVQSNFSFIFHLLPGAVLLGISLSLTTLTDLSQSPNSKPNKLLAPIVFALAAVLFGIGSMHKSWQHTLVTWQIWPLFSENGKIKATPDALKRIQNAIRINPTPDLYKLNSRFLQPTSDDDIVSIQLAISLNNQASSLNPYDPAPVINKANLLSYLGKDSLAETSYKRAIKLQGSMEPAFQARRKFASHLYRKARQGRIEKAEQSDPLSDIQEAALQISRVLEVTPFSKLEPSGQQLFVKINSFHGYLLAEEERLEESIDAYNLACSIWEGKSQNYSAGRVYTKIGNYYWMNRQPDKALTSFKIALARIAEAGRHLPDGVTDKMRRELVEYLTSIIKFLDTAGITEAESDEILPIR